MKIAGPRGAGGFFQKNWMRVCDQKFDTLFQTCLIISSLGQTNVKENVYMLLLSRIQNRTKLQA